MSELSISSVERQSGVPKHPEETLGEYLNRVDDYTDLPPEDVEAIVNYANRQQFGSGRDPSSTRDPPIEEFLRAISSIETTNSETTSDATAQVDQQ